MKRPAFQFYTGDWRGNAKLRRCTHAERGIWIEVMCLMHDSEEYGVLRWPLKDIAQAVSCRMSEIQALVIKDVLKGGDSGCDPFIFTPRHAGKDGEPVILLPHQTGPVWYSSRMVKDEYVRQQRGIGTRFGDEPNPTPIPPIGTRQGDGPSSSSSSSISKEPKTKTKAPGKRAISADFGISDQVRSWAAEKGHDHLEKRLTHFVGTARAKGYTYADWDSAFMNAIRDDWAKLSVATPDYSNLNVTDGV